MKRRLPGTMWSLAGFCAAEWFLYLSYQEHDGLFHWFLHFFAGSSAALLTMAVITVRLGWVIPHPLVWIFASHLIAILPDILWNFRLATHQPWMDLFLGHIATHFIPGRNWTWYAIFLASLAVYFYARASVESRARHVRSHRGQRPQVRRAFVCSMLLVLLSLSGPVRGETPVWIDTDAAPNVPFRDKDDLFALLAAFEAPELKIRGISLVFGNHHDVEAVQPEIRDLVGRFAPEPIRVYAGAGAAADLGRATEASTALGDALSREALVIVALGPLTNVATVLQQHRELAPNVKRIIAVAGRRPDQAFLLAGGRLTLPDLNFESDVAAFRVVLEQGIPLTLIPFELSRQMWITASDLRAMRDGSPAARWLAHQSTGWLDLWAHGIGTLGFHPFDGPTLTYLLSREFLRCRTEVPALIGSTPGDSWWARLFGTRKPLLLVSDDLVSAYRVDYCVGVDPGAKEELLTRIKRLGSSRPVLGKVGS